MKKEKRRGPKSTVTFVVDKKALKYADGRIKQVLKTKIKKFAKSGGYIPISQDYSDHEALLIVMENKK